MKTERPIKTVPAGEHTIMTPANGVTLLRILLAPVVVAAIYFYAPAWWVLIFGFLSMITDRVDGWLARKYGVSALGTFLDPLADKIIVLGAFGALVALDWVWWVPAFLIAARELAMSFWRSRLAKRGISVPATELARFKTWAQSVAVAIALTPGVVEHAKWVLDAAVWFAVAITMITFAQYIRGGVAAQSKKFT